MVSRTNSFLPLSKCGPREIENSFRDPFLTGGLQKEDFIQSWSQLWLVLDAELLQDVSPVVLIRSNLLSGIIMVADVLKWQTWIIAHIPFPSLKRHYSQYLAVFDSFSVYSADQQFSWSQVLMIQFKTWYHVSLQIILSEVWLFVLWISPWVFFRLPL